MAYQAIARRHTWYFLPADEMLAMFHHTFPSGTPHFEPYPRIARLQAAALPTFPLFAQMIQKVRALGHNPEDVRLGDLFLEGKKRVIIDCITPRNYRPCDRSCALPHPN
jgi:hypothetical protein